MSRVFIGDYPFNGTFEAGIAGPVDARYVVEEYSDLMLPDTWPSGIADAYIYEGMQVYVRADKKVYILVDAANYQSDSSWKELASDVKGASIDIEDNLYSTRTDAALSANQGRVLDEKITSLEDKIFDGEKIDTSLLPEFNTGLFYGGTINSSGYCTLTKALKEKLGFAEDIPDKYIGSLNVSECADVYFIASEAGGQISIEGTVNLILPARSAGDWIISNGTKWEIILSNAVTSVVGKTGAITREQLLDALAYDEDKDAEDAAEGGFVRKNEINRLDARIEGFVETTSHIGTKVVNIEKTLTWTTML